MGLFGKSRSEKIAEIEQKVTDIAVSTLTSIEMVEEERIDLITNIESTIDENFDNRINVRKKIIRLACRKLISDYPDFKERIETTEYGLCSLVDEDSTIDINVFNTLLFDIHWKHFVTPEDAEKIYKDTKADGGIFSTKEYKMIINKIAEKYEEELLTELNSVKTKDINSWIDETKRKGKSISDKVYEKAMEIKNKQ